MQTILKKSEERLFLSDLNSLITVAQTVVITAHKSPDDDAISSLLATYRALSKMYPMIKFRLLYAGTRTDRWAYFADYALIEFGVDPGSINEADLILITDASGWGRVSDLPVSDKIKVVIDHHKSTPDEEMRLCYIDTDATSCAEIVYRLFYKEDTTIDHQTAEILMLGILGDTGSFTYVRSDQTDVFNVAERLVREGGVNIQSLKSQYMQYSQETFSLLKVFMNNFEIVQDEKCGTYCYAYINREQVKAITELDSELSAAAHIFVDNYIKSIKGIKWGFVVYPMMMENIYKVSARSLPDGMNVRVLFEGMGKGGGHDLASGGKFIGAKSAEEVIAEIKTHLCLQHTALQTN